VDFFQIAIREIERGPDKGKLEIYPDFVIGRSKDLMVRGRSFYAIWDEDANMWSTDEYDVQRIVDSKLKSYAKENPGIAKVKYMRSFGSKGWTQFRNFVNQVSDNSTQLDTELTFANSTVTKQSYASKRLPYSLAPGDISAWDELMNVLYAEEREKIEWAIGAVVAGDAKKIQKFLVFYGSAGTGKSTTLEIIQKLFTGYTTTFEAKALGSNNNQFATEVFRATPLVALQHDGDLSKIEDNTKLNSIVSHEDMVINEKYRAPYTSRILAFLFMGTNQPVKISDSKSGIIRRLIDVHPTGNKIPFGRYQQLMSQVEFELGAIAHHCLDVYSARGKSYYNAYRPLEMMFQTDVFFNFVEFYWDIFSQQNGTTLKQAYAMYKEYCNETGIERALPQYKVREELRNYFDEFHDRTTVDGVVVRSYYSGFKKEHYKAPVDDDNKAFSLVVDQETSILDLELGECPAQYAKDDGTPQRRWALVKTTLAEIDTRQLHYVKVPENHIVLDFDLVDEVTGEKSLEKNLEEAAKYPATYAEISKSGKAVHNHYYWDGEVADLAAEVSPGIEIKRFTGNSSLRRLLTKCNNVPIATLNGGLPLKEKKPVLTEQTIQSERGLRDLINRNLRKEIHPGTKPSIDFIHKILEDAYDSKMSYDVSDLKTKVITFANNSSNQPLQSLMVVKKMKWKSRDAELSETIPETPNSPAEQLPAKDAPLTFYDVEVYPNLFVICWKHEDDDNVVAMINPKPHEVEALFKFKLVGFNNRRYDNHILYGAYMGMDNQQLYELSQKIISGSVGSMFGEAYNLSYADIYDYSSKKQGLKKWQIELKIRHEEMDIPWDQPVPKEKILKVVEYCKNDVRSTQAVHEARRGDFVAREILAALSGLTANDTTAKNTAKLIFGDDRNARAGFVYTDLSKDFPGYVFDKGVSTYRDETVGEGGYVYAEPGIYRNVALLDVASMHPTSLVQLNLFGEYTPVFQELMEARLAIKRGDLETARSLFGGRLAPFLEDESLLKALADALKIAINSVYGLTSAKFDNPFKDMRNVDNIVAKRGALFMIDLKHYLQERGFTVAHIKTDSVKIPDATPEIIEEVKLFGEKYGYTFEHEATYVKMALVNDAVYIAKKDECIDNCWVAVGKQFQHPYVFNSLFGYEDDITFDSLCETKEVNKGAIYLDFDSTKPMHQTDIPMDLHFVGRTGRFVPVKEGFGGGILYRVQDEKQYAVAGTKGYLWLEANQAEKLGMECIDMSYFEKLVDDALNTIGKFGDVNEFTDC
jgi:uncharacterized protein DUF5906